MELLHRYTRLKDSVVYRVPDDLNDLNGLNCLNKQRSLPSGLVVLDEGLMSSGSQNDPGIDRD